MNNHRILVSRNKREGHYVGVWRGWHIRGHVVWNRWKKIRTSGNWVREIIEKRLKINYN